MSVVLRSLLVICFLLVFLVGTTNAQRNLKNKLGGLRGNNQKNSDNDSGNQRNDFEGVVWEFKVIDRKERDKSKQTRMVGRIRVKQSAVFSVGKVEQRQSENSLSAAEEANQLVKDFDGDGNGQLNANELTAMVKSIRNGDRSLTSSASGAGNKMSKSGPGNSRSNLQGDMKSLLSQRLRDAQQEDVGGSSRIGDVSLKGSQGYVFQFDQDDDHPLSGRAELKKDRKDRGGVWFGDYAEYVNGKKAKTWRIEMRKIDE